VKVNQSEYTIYIDGCKTYQDVAEVIRKKSFPTLTTVDYLELVNPDSGVIDLKGNIHSDYSSKSVHTIHARRADDIKVKVNQSEYTIYIDGCKTYQDVAEVIRKKSFPAATCVDQILLFDSDNVLIDLGEVFARKNTFLTAKMMIKKIQIVQDVTDWPLTSDTVKTWKTIQSDAQIARIWNGLVEIGKDGYPVDESLIDHLHLLKDGFTYFASLHPGNTFALFANIEGMITENEVALAIKRTLDPQGKFKTLHRKIMRPSGGIAQEWDAVLHDPIGERLIFAEVKHKVTTQHIKEICEKFSELSTLLRETKTPHFESLADKPRSLIIGGSIFEEKAVSEVLRLTDQINSHGGVQLCYPDGSRYSLHPEQEHINREISHLSFTTTT
jgi:hypothetical protein